MVKKPTASEENSENPGDSVDQAQRGYEGGNTEIARPSSVTSGELTIAPNVGISAAVISGQAISVGGRTLKIKSRVAMPVLPLADNSEVVVRIMEPITEGKQVMETKAGKPKMAPARVTTIMALDGEMRTLIANTVLESELDRAYPNATYVGKWFYLKKLPKRPERDYHTFVISEVELEDAA